MNRQEAQAKIAELVIKAREAVRRGEKGKIESLLQEAQKLTDEYALPFFGFGVDVVEPLVEVDDFDDSTCTDWDDSTC